MDFIKCRRCGDIIAMLVASCPMCGACPSCGRRNRRELARCRCDYPESAFAVDNVREYYGISDQMVEAERRRFALRRSFVHQMIFAVIGPAMLFTAAGTLAPLLFASGLRITFLLLLPSELVVVWIVMGILRRRHVRLMCEITERDCPTT